MTGDDCRTASEASRIFDQAIKHQSLSQLGAIIDNLHSIVGICPHITIGTAASALEQALWDLFGQQVGIPLCDLLGGARRSDIPLYANINRGLHDRSPESFATQARAAVDDGFKAVKFMPFDQVTPDMVNIRHRLVAEGLERIKAVRSAVGSSGEMIVDCHGRLHVSLAIKVAEQIQPYGLRWYEEPVKTHRDVYTVTGIGGSSEVQRNQDGRLPYAEPSLSDCMHIAQSCTVPLAAGEFAFGTLQFAHLLKSGAFALLMPDVKHCGGVWEALKISTLAAAHGVTITPHNPSGPVSTAVTGHLCAALPAIELVEYQWGEVPFRSQLVDPPERLSEGCLKVSDQPGIGMTLNDDAVMEYRINLD